MLNVMRSQVIKVRNLPHWQTQPHSIHVKPALALSILGIFGLGLLAAGMFTGIGLVLIIFSVFALLMMPDRTLMQFTPEYAVLYNHRDNTLCTVIYWEDVVNWQYEYHPYADLLSFSLVDGSTQSIELFSKRAAARYLNQYAPGKEIRTTRRKDPA